MVVTNPKVLKVHLRSVHGVHPISDQQLRKYSIENQEVFMEADQSYVNSSETSAISHSRSNVEFIRLIAEIQQTMPHILNRSTDAPFNHYAETTLSVHGSIPDANPILGPFESIHDAAKIAAKILPPTRYHPYLSKLRHCAETISIAEYNPVAGNNKYPVRRLARDQSIERKPVSSSDCNLGRCYHYC